MSSEITLLEEEKMTTHYILVARETRRYRQKYETFTKIN